MSNLKRNGGGVIRTTSVKSEKKRKGVTGKKRVQLGNKWVEIG